MTALQTSDANKVATPEGWQQGDKVIVPPPATTEAAEAQVNEGTTNVQIGISAKKVA